MQMKWLGIRERGGEAMPLHNLPQLTPVAVIRTASVACGVPPRELDQLRGWLLPCQHMHGPPKHPSRNPGWSEPGELAPLLLGSAYRSVSIIDFWNLSLETNTTDPSLTSCWRRTAIRRTWCIVTRYLRSNSSRPQVHDTPRHPRGLASTMKMLPMHLLERQGSGEPNSLAEMTRPR